MNLYRIILPVNDINRIAAFYEAVFDQKGMRVSPGRHYFDLGSVILACYDPVADGDGGNDEWHQHPNQYLYFSVPDLVRTRGKVREAGGTLVTAIEDMPWGERLFYARDPSDNPVAFVEEKTVFRG